MDFWTHGPGKNLFVNCLKSHVSENPSTSNIVNGPKHCSNLNFSTISIFIDLCVDNSGWKGLSEWYAKSSDCLLTHSLSKISILFLTEAIYCNIFREYYLRNDKRFFDFCFPFSRFRFNFGNFQKKDDPPSSCIFEFPNSEKPC